MAFERKAASLWHAFNALDDHSTNKVNKSQLKVLTHNIANSVGLETYITEILEALDTHKEQETDITFLEYFFFLKIELFDRLRNSGDINANADLSKCDEICWFLCMKSYLKRDLKILCGDDAFKVFQVFNLHCEVDSSGAVSYPVRCDQEEVGIFAKKFCSVVGFEFDQEEFDKIAREIPLFNFQQMLVLLETQYCKTADNALISSAVSEIHAEIIRGVVKKGFLSKKGQKISSIKERWFVLTPHRLVYYTASDEREQKGEVMVTNRSTVEAVADKTDKTGKCFKFVLHVDGRNLDMIAADLGTRAAWISAIKHAIEFCNKPLSSQQLALAKRRGLREKKRAQEREEQERREREEEDNRKTREQLDTERQARETAEHLMKEAERRKLEEEERLRQEAEDQKRQYEEKLKLGQEERNQAESDLKEQMKDNEAKLKQEMEEKEREMQEILDKERQEKEEYEKKLAEEKKLQELQENRITELMTLKQDLETHLEEEIQAKKDEEIVRSAQSRVLKEEMEKREELERLKDQMDQLLLDEAKKRIDLEEAKSEQEQVLLAEREKLMSLENERREIEEQLRTAQANIENAAKAKQKVVDAVDEEESKLSSIKKKLREIMGSGPRASPSHRGIGAFTPKEFETRERIFSQKKEGSFDMSQEETALLDTSLDDNVMTPPVTPGNTGTVFEEISLQ